MMRNLYLFIMIALITGISSCQGPIQAGFEVELDPNMPGKVNVINTSTNAKRYEWQVWLKDTENGTPYQSSSYGNGLNSDDENPSFYIQEETWIQIDLRAMNAIMESNESKSFEVANLPDTLIIGDLVVTSINMRDENGFEWDDTDGTANFGDYSNTSAFPDLLLNTEQWSSGYVDNDVQQWDVNIETGLPITLTTDGQLFDNFSPQTDDFYIELVDFDGTQGSIFFGPGKQMGYASFNPYHLTHVYNDGDEDNYPSVYHITTDHYEADLYMTWQ